LALFLHFREDRLEVLELNSTANRFIVTQIGFAFPDYEMTSILRQQATQDIGKIYKIDEKQIREVRSHLEGVIHRQKSRLTEMYKLADLIETLLFEARFTDLSTIQKLLDYSLPASSYYESSSESIPQDFWQLIRASIAQGDYFHPETVQSILGQFQEVHWKLSEDLSLEHSLRLEIGESIPEQMTHVRAGTRIIDQGEKITTRHLAMLQAMKKALAENRRLAGPLSWIASFILSLIFVTISALYFRISQPDFIRSLRRISLFVCIVILTLLLAKLTEYVLLRRFVIQSSLLLQLF
jgi:cyclic-di-AMP phosphodiesterase PgpH